MWSSFTFLPPPLFWSQGEKNLERNEYQTRKKTNIHFTQPLYREAGQNRIHYNNSNWWILWVKVFLLTRSHVLGVRSSWSQVKGKHSVIIDTCEVVWHWLPQNKNHLSWQRVIAREKRSNSVIVNLKLVLVFLGFGWAESKNINAGISVEAFLPVWLLITKPVCILSRRFFFVFVFNQSTTQCFNTW